MDNCFKFYKNTDCEYFPCHATDDEENFNCMFCYCPLYPLGSKCGGDFGYLDNGTKDCSNCLLTHRPESFDYIMSKWDMINNIAKNNR